MAQHVAAIGIRTGLALLLLLAPLSAARIAVGAAEPTPLPGIVGGDDRQRLSARNGWPWDSIGRVSRESGGFCTGTLVAPDLVLTAAHCLWDRRTRRMLRPERLHFAAGYWRGTWIGHAQGRGIRTDPALELDARGRPRDIATDWAILVLSNPLPEREALRPVGLAPKGAAQDAIARRAPIARAGYGQDRQHGLSRHMGCRALGLIRDDRVLLHDCDATLGESGSPLLLETGSGMALLGVHVAALEADGGRLGAAVLVTSDMLPAR